jgi:hypothetical protein
MKICGLELSLGNLFSQYMQLNIPRSYLPSKVEILMQRKHARIRMRERPRTALDYHGHRWCN